MSRSRDISLQSCHEDERHMCLNQVLSIFSTLGANRCHLWLKYPLKVGKSNNVWIPNASKKINQIFFLLSNLLFSYQGVKSNTKMRKKRKLL